MMHPARSRHSAFTLVELLVVIAIIAILAAVLLPVLGRIQEGGNSTKCSANLRQIGAAINAYTADNDSQLPGPLEIWQNPTAPPVTAGSPGTDEANDHQLVRILAKYVGANSATTPSERNSIFICPSFQRVVPLLDAPVYVLNPRQVNDLGKPPFGDVNGKKDPLRKAVLSNWVDNTDGKGEQPVQLTATWAMKDADAQAFVNVKETAPAPPSTTLPQKPVHGDHRNALFYDWHVAKLSADPLTNDFPK